ncbi:MAG: hypothetical protein HY814_01080 [Candidatus Riflebacteria bacterium]|nr:hypothetical protein [Candidatus Riflebacteria bacterium]
MKHARVYVRGIGAALPGHVVPNETLAKLNGIDPSWLVERTGIESRCLSSHDERTSTLASVAAREALEGALTAPEDVDLVVLATSFPDALLPLSTAGIVKDRLGLRRALAIDIGTPAIGFLIALQVALQYLQRAGLDTALVIGAECFSSVGDLRDRRTCYLFGDGAGAMLLSRSRGFATLGAPVIETAGSNGETLPDPEVAAPEDRFYALALYQQPIERLRDGFERTVRTLMAAESLRLGDVEYVLPQQMHRQAVEGAARALGLTNGTLFDELLRSGNLLSATLPVSLYQLLCSGKVAKGDHVALIGTDGRYQWGGLVVSVTGKVPSSAREVPAEPAKTGRLPESRPGRPTTPAERFVPAAELATILGEEVRKAEIFGSVLSTVFFAVEHPESLGSSMEEQMSRETRLLFSRQIRRRDMVFEVSPTRFAVILPNQDATDARRIAERLKVLLEHLDPVEEIEVKALYDTLTFQPGTGVDDYVGEVVRRSAR